MRALKSAVARGFLLAIVLTVSACNRTPASAPLAVAGGDPSQAPALIRHYGCAACHTIPGVPGATGQVGPALSNLRDRAYIAGVLSNSPDNLVQWIQHPRRMAPRTAMPETGITEAEARHVAAYLYTK